MEHVLAGMAVTTFIKDSVELGWKIKDSIDQVGKNKEQLLKLRDEVTGTLYGLVGLAQEFNNAQPSLDLLTALEDLKNHLESVHSKCQRASQHSSWFKSWWNRDKIDQEIRRLNELKHECHKPIRNTTARIEGSMAQFRGAITQIKDSTSRIDHGTAQVTDTTTRIEGAAIQIVDTTTQITAATTQIERSSTALLVDTTSRIEHAANEVAVMVLQQKLERWLEHPPNMKKRQEDMQDLQHEGTGAWFLGSDQFKGWKDKPGSLWIRGDFIAGTGKSVLSSTVIWELFSERQPRTAIAYFYFDFRYEKSQHVKIMLQSIILQLSVQSPNSYSALERVHKSSQGQTLPTYDKLLDITHQDIRWFINSELHSLSHLTRQICAKEITEKVVVKSNGMFRLAALLLMELRDAFNPDLHAILTSFPDNLFGVYSRFLQRIHPTAVFYVLAVLRWLAFSSEPVTMACLEDALVFNFSNPSEFVYDLARRGENADRVCKMLEGLIVVNQEWDFWEDENTRTVTLAHASVKDYLRSEKFAQEYPGYDLRVGPSHRFLAQTCLGYLLQFIDHPLTRKTRTNYPLGTYAAENWYYHLGRSNDPALLSSLVVGLFGSDFQFTKPLSVCSRLGYTEAVRFLLQNGADPNMDDNGYTALQVASRLRHPDIVRILLQSGANVDIVVLDEACIRSHWDIVPVLSLRVKT
ncbi:hypothetical protein B0H14DRAFT_3558555 [Mycena olivaceomarginata]|nr:hypothetical protein B0H14DRAFT_3558555 [Mycena olivaceomarginata]